MKPSASDFVLRARQLDLQAMAHLAARARLAEAVGQWVHALQRERGMTSMYLASGGERFADERAQAVAQSEQAENSAMAAFALQLAPGSGASASMMSLMGWTMLDLGHLGGLRAAISQGAPHVNDAVAGFSRVIAGLIELIFHLADDAPEPVTSRLLVALAHLFQVKESAGQERALGAQLLASGICTEGEQQRYVHLIDAQERAADVLLHFVDDDLAAGWHHTQRSSHMAQLERMRRSLCTARIGASLDKTLSEAWFDVSSRRIDELAQLAANLVQRLHDTCQQASDRAQQNLNDSAGLLKQLTDNPPPHAQAVDRYFSPHGQPDAVPTLHAKRMPPSASLHTDDNTLPPAVATLQALLESQSSRLAQTEMELQKARQALHERKVVERAKGALMNRLGISEDSAYRALQKAAMDNNKRLLDVAEAALTLGDLALGTVPGKRAGG